MALVALCFMQFHAHIKTWHSRMFRAVNLDHDMFNDIKWHKMTGGWGGGRGGEPFEETRFAGNLSRFLLSEIFAVRHEVPEVKIQEEEKKKKNDEAVFHGFSRGSGRTHRRLQGWAKHVQYLHGRVEQDSYDAQELRICFDQTMRRSIRS